MDGIGLQKLNEAMALISVAGFAAQRALELLDPLAAIGTYGLTCAWRYISRLPVMSAQVNLW